MATAPIGVSGTIAGRPIDDEHEGTIDVLDPSTGEVLATAPVCTAVTVDRAAAAAAEAMATWSETTPLERDELLCALADAVMDKRDELARLEAANVGKPLAAASEEVEICASTLRYFGGAGRTIEGRAAGEYARGRTSMIRRDPVGVVGQITPWNYPLMMAVWKLGPALAAGNAVVLKPSELTPLTTVRLAELAREILPPGVLNVVTGDGRRTGEALVASPRVRMVCLTGDVATGRTIGARAAGTVKRLHLELGGKAPVIVFDDADLEALAETVRGAGYINSGQDCTAATRLLVSGRRHDDLLAALVPQVEGISVGGPFDSGPAAEVGPLISAAQRERVTGMIEGAVEKGGKLAAGGTPLDRPGFFVEPTVVAELAQEDEIVQREVFGPVVTVQHFADEEEALARANGVEYGLAASVWSRDVSRCLRMARRLQFGTVWLNDHGTLTDEMPHGGFKQSGFGKDLSPYSIEDYTVVKHVMAAL